MSELEVFLREQYEEATASNAASHSSTFQIDYKRLVCFYDWLRYGPRK